MNIILPILAAGLVLASCSEGTYCTEEFRSVGFTWTSQDVPQRVSVTNIRTGDSIRVLSGPYEHYIPIADDGSMNQLRSEGDSLRVVAFGPADSILATAWFVVGKDQCHIIFHYGPEFLP